MNFLKSNVLTQKTVLFSVFLHFSYVSFSQKADSTKVVNHISGAVTLTNNGISLIPTFSLGKPATVLDFSAGRKRLSFDPQLRFALEDGKPWSFVFWVRYKLIQNDKFKLGIGTHPAVVFNTTTAVVNGTSKELLTAKRYWASEIASIYTVSKNVRVGLYYLYGYGISADASRNTHFLGLNASFLHVKLSDQFFLKFNPQVFYLKIDANDGFFLSETVTLAKRNFPFSLSSIATKTLTTNLAGVKDFVWNVNLIYAF